MIIKDDKLTKLNFLVWGGLALGLVVASPTIYEWAFKEDKMATITIIADGNNFDQAILDNYGQKNNLKIVVNKVNSTSEVISVLRSNPLNVDVLDLSESSYLMLNESKSLKPVSSDIVDYPSKIEKSEIRRAQNLVNAPINSTRIQGIPYQKLAYVIVYDRGKQKAMINKWSDLWSLSGQIGVPFDENIIFGIVANSLIEENILDNLNNDQKIDVFHHKLMALTEHIAFINSPKNFNDVLAFASDYQAIIVPSSKIGADNILPHQNVIKIPSLPLLKRQYLAIPITADVGDKTKGLFNYLLSSSQAGKQMELSGAWSNIFEGQDFLRLNRSASWTHFLQYYPNNDNENASNVEANTLTFMKNFRLERMWLDFVEANNNFQRKNNQNSSTNKS